MRISQLIENNDHHSILEDKRFIKQFALLLSLIIAISLFLIYDSIDRIDRLTISQHGGVSMQQLSLADVEKRINGNEITLDNDFDDLVESDLHALAMVEQRPAFQERRAGASAPAVKQKRVAAEEKKAAVDHHKPVITITSTPLQRTTHQGKVNLLKQLRKKFYATNDVKYAFAIVEELMAAKRYQKALKWALIANELAPESAKSWMLFAKAKLKLGKKADAINVLQAYLKTYDSAKVSRFLKQIKSS